MYPRFLLPALCLAILSTAQSQETANPAPAQAAPRADPIRNLSRRNPAYRQRQPLASRVPLTTPLARPI